MRLWHYELLPYLPKYQLKSQWRECVCIAKSIHDNRTPNHILVNPIMNYPIEEFNDYCNHVLNAMMQRNISASESTLDKLNKYTGFGSRMSGALLSGNNYCGFDPNRTLFKQLVAYKNFLTKNGVIEPSRRCGLYNHGSEIHRPELDGLFDVSFTSPPYFNLEKYSDDDSESTKNYNNYQAWVDYFVIPTVTNTYMYLKVGGYAMINIKNINKSNPCYDDFFKAFSSINGFEFVEELDMSFNKKQYGKQYNDEKGVIKNSEPIMVFRKVK